MFGIEYATVIVLETWGLGTAGPPAGSRALTAQWGLGQFSAIIRLLVTRITTSYF